MKRHIFLVVVMSLVVGMRADQVQQKRVDTDMLTMYMRPDYVVGKDKLTNQCWIRPLTSSKIAQIPTDAQACFEECEQQEKSNILVKMKPATAKEAAQIIFQYKQREFVVNPETVQSEGKKFTTRVNQLSPASEHFMTVSPNSKQTWSSWFMKGTEYALQFEGHPEYEDPIVGPDVKKLHASLEATAQYEKQASKPRAQLALLDQAHNQNLAKILN